MLTLTGRQQLFRELLPRQSIIDQSSAGSFFYGMADLGKSAPSGLGDLESILFGSRQHG